MSRARWVGIMGAVALLAAGGAAAQGVPHQYVGASKCKTCHKKELMGDQYGTWSDGPHAEAFETLEEDDSTALAAKLGVAGPASEASECLSCHVTAFGQPAEAFYKDLEFEDGVQCESCHGPGRDYRKKKIMSDPEQAKAKGLWDPGAHAKICTECHNPRSPTWDPARYTLPDGTTAGFHFEQAKTRIAHPIPEDVKGRYLELEKAQKEAARD